MTVQSPTSRLLPLPRLVPFYYGWVIVVLAALAMMATLPGRTHGLGLVTEPLLADLHLDRVLFARLNLAGTLLGAAFCLPIGWSIDRFGVRVVLAAVTAALGLAVIGMSHVDGPGTLLLGLVLVRGFGQSALSIVSMAAIGKWFRRRLGLAMGLFAVLLTFGFIGSVLATGAAVERWGWRDAWQGLGWAVLALAPLFWLLARSGPPKHGLSDDDPTGTLPADNSAAHAARSRDDEQRAPLAQAPASRNLRQALATPAFWIVLLGTSAFNLVWSGVTLFNESLLAERGLDPSFAVEIMAILTGVGLLANLAAGALANRARVVKLLGLGLIVLSIGLATLPAIGGASGARLYALLIGTSGGIVTVVFFAAWGHLFGQAHLGRIQGAAQLATVLASASGPLVIAEGFARTGSYSPMFYALSGLVMLLALAALFSPRVEEPAQTNA
ncbi:MAG: MFS transporter [Pirellulales bacterium]